MELVTLVLVLLSVVCATLPMGGFLVLVWWFDRYDREPIWLILLTFFWGAVGGVALAIVANTSLAVLLALVFDAATAEVLTPVVVAPFIEEPTKALVLFVVAQSRHFDNTTDGFVYGAATGLGFAMTENFVYFAGMASQGVGPWMVTVVIRTFYSAVMHGAASSCVGAALGFARFRGWRTRLLVVPMGFAAAMGMHFLWNFLLVAGGQLQAGAFTAFNLMLFPVEFAVVFGIFQLCLWDERATIQRELLHEAHSGTLPKAHVPVLASFFQRNRAGWLEESIPLHTYVRTATSLAFRRHQMGRTHGAQKAFYTREVERLRGEIILMRHTRS